MGRSVSVEIRYHTEVNGVPRKRTSVLGKSFEFTKRIKYVREDDVLTRCLVEVVFKRKRQKGTFWGKGEVVETEKKVWLSFDAFTFVEEIESHCIGEYL